MTVSQITDTAVANELATATQYNNVVDAFNNLVTGENALNINTITEVTADAGVTIEGVLLKDNAVQLPTVNDGVVGDGAIWMSTSGGLSIQCATGSASDLAIYDPGNNGAILYVPTGTYNVIMGNGSLTVDSFVRADGGFKYGATTVVGAQGSAVADATDAASAITQLNALLAEVRTHGLIAT